MRIGLHLTKLEETPAADSPLFTELERRYCLDRRDPLPHLAARYAAKRALAGALGLDPDDGNLTEVEVARESGRAPTLRLRGEAHRVAAVHGLRHTHLSLSHSGAYAVALVVME